MPQNERIPTEDKVKAVEKCLRGTISINECAARTGVSTTTLNQWIRLYEVRGAEGLKPTEEYRRYTAETKTRAVEDYLSDGGSLNSICKKYDISNKSMLQKWIKRYNDHGDFKQPNTGGAIYMVKSRETTLDERIEIVSYCIANNKDYGKTIEQYGVSYKQIYGWVRKYESEGADGLIDSRGRRKPEDSMNEVEKLKAQLKLKEAENLRLQMENDLLKKLEEIERRRGLD